MNSKYPRGKLNQYDEGQTVMAISTEDKTVIIEFPNPTKWIGLDRNTALKLAESIKNHAQNIQ